MAKLKRINNLTTISGLTSQMRAVYRLARINTDDEDVDPQAAKVLVDILRTITVAYRDNELEQQFDEQERTPTLAVPGLPAVKFIFLPSSDLPEGHFRLRWNDE